MRDFSDDYPFNAGRMAAAPLMPDYVENVLVGAGATVRVAIPRQARFALFSFDGDVRVKAGTATTIVSGAATADGSGSELNPVARRLPQKTPDGGEDVTHLCLTAPAAASGSISFYA